MKFGDKLYQDKKWCFFVFSINFLKSFLQRAESIFIFYSVHISQME